MIINQTIRGAYVPLIILLLISCKDNVSTIKRNDFSGWNVINSSKINIYPIAIEDHIIVSSYCDSNIPCIKNIQLNSGKEVWSYSDKDFDGIFYNMTTYQTPNKVILPLPNKTICLDKNTGSLDWEYKYDSTFVMESHISGINDNIYRAGKNNNGHTVFVHSAKTGEGEILIEIPVKKEFNSILRTPIAFQGEKIHLITCLDLYDTKIKKSSGSIISISETKKINLISINRDIKNANFQPIAYNNDTILLLINMNVMVLYDIKKNILLWESTFPSSILTSRIEIVNDTIYYPSEDQNLYAINAKNGQTYWKSKSSGTPSNLAMNHKYIFMTNGNGGILKQFEKTNGKLVRDYNFKSYLQNFKRTIAIKNNIIIFTDGRFWYARDIEKMEIDPLF